MLRAQRNRCTEGQGTDFFNSQSMFEISEKS